MTEKTDMPTICNCENCKHWCNEQRRTTVETLPDGRRKTRVLTFCAREMDRNLVRGLVANLPTCDARVSKPGEPIAWCDKPATRECGARLDVYYRCDEHRPKDHDAYHLESGELPWAVALRRIVARMEEWEH